MSNIMPIRQQVSAPSQQDWWCDPPSTWPPQPCPTPPSCFSQVAKADACWDQSQALYNLVSKVVMDIFQTNPGIIPPPPPSAGSGAIKGITDGSAALPGNVGEFIIGTSSQSYLGYPTATQWTAQSPIIVPPGDWDLWAFMQFSTFIGGAFFTLSPVPSGVTCGMTGQAFTSDAGTPVASAFTVIGEQAVGNFTVPTLLAFTGNINNSTSSGLTAGNATLTVQGRRRR